MSLRIAQCTSSSQQSVTGSIFQRPHGKKAPQNGHHRFGIDGHVEIQTFFPEDHNINQGNENEWHTHITYRYIDPSRHNFDYCLPSLFVSQSCLGQPSRQFPKLWREGSMSRYVMWIAYRTWAYDEECRGKLVFGITNCQTTQLVVDWPIENLLLINIMVH